MYRNGNGQSLPPKSRLRNLFLRYLDFNEAKEKHFSQPMPTQTQNSLWPPLEPLNIRVAPNAYELDRSVQPEKGQTSQNIGNSYSSSYNYQQPKQSNYSTSGNREITQDKPFFTQTSNQGNDKLSYGQNTSSQQTGQTPSLFGQTSSNTGSSRYSTDNSYANKSKPSYGNQMSPSYTPQTNMQQYGSQVSRSQYSEQKPNMNQTNMYQTQGNNAAYGEQKPSMTYGNQTNANYGKQTNSMFGGQSNPSYGNQPNFGNQTNTTYGSQTSAGYGNQTSPSYKAPTSPSFGNQTNTPYGAQTSAGYGNQTSPSYRNSPYEKQNQGFALPKFGNSSNYQQPNASNSSYKPKTAPPLQPLNMGQGYNQNENKTVKKPIAPPPLQPFNQSSPYTKQGQMPMFNKQGMNDQFKQSPYSQQGMNDSYMFSQQGSPSMPHSSSSPYNKQNQGFVQPQKYGQSSSPYSQQTPQAYMQQNAKQKNQPYMSQSLSSNFNQQQQQPVPIFGNMGSPNTQNYGRQNMQQFNQKQQYGRQIPMPSNISHQTFTPFGTNKIMQPNEREEYTRQWELNKKLHPDKGRGRKLKNKEDKKKKGRSRKTSDSDDYDSYDNQFDSEDLQFIERRVSTRKTHNVNYDDNETTEIEDEEEEAAPVENQQEKIDHVYFQRQTPNGTELLVKFQDAKQALCKWCPESEIEAIPTAQNYLQRFKKAPIDLSILDHKDECSPPFPIAHRCADPQSPCQLLFRLMFEGNVLFYWDNPTQEVLNQYWSSRINVDILDVRYPSSLPEPLPYVKTEENRLRSYQITGLKWLIDCWVKKHGSILADEMGLGKTIQILSFLEYIHKYCGWHGPFLCVVRTNCIQQWIDEIKKWTSLKVIAYTGRPAAREFIRNYQMPSLDTLGSPYINSDGELMRISFNILLISYDLLLKDWSHFKFKWQVMVVDEGHRIRNSKGKKNNVYASLPCQHRIILTGTPVQSSLSELWALLKFVSPNQFSKDPPYLEDEIENLPPEIIREVQMNIQPHLLRRSLSEVEHSIAPKEERVALVKLCDIQQDLMRLIKLHSLWRLKRIQVNEETIDSSHESNDMHKVCLHPFLIDSAEDFYTDLLKLPRLELLLTVSCKFQWLNRVLPTLKAEGRKVLIFSQSVKLLRLLKEFCDLKGYQNEMLIGQMSEIEKTAAVSRFADPETSSFIFLISTKAGSEGLNLTIADTAIIFDPDWNPQNDLQAQARVHRIGQTQKVDIIRLITYKTYEHSMFVRAQRKLELWRTLLGGTVVEDLSLTLPPLPPPPPIDWKEPSSNSFNEEINKVSSILDNFSPSNLGLLEAPLKDGQEEKYEFPDDVFLEQFPVEEEIDERRTKRVHYMTDTITSSEATDLFIMMQHHDYGRWFSKTDRSDDQVKRFCLSTICFCMQSLEQSAPLRFPLLLYHLEEDIPEFSFSFVCASKKRTITNTFPPYHEFATDAESCLYISDMIAENAERVLLIIETRLVIQAWLETHSKSDLTESECGDFNIPQETAKVLFDGTFDVYDQPVIYAVTRMRSDLIAAHFGRISRDKWWTWYEFDAICYTLKNFYFSAETALEFHTKTGLLSKRTEDVVLFTMQFKKLLIEKKHSRVSIPSSMAHRDDAPEEIRNAKVWKWMELSRSDCMEMNNKIELVDGVHMHLEGLLNRNIPNEPDDPTVWSEYHEKIFFERLSSVGIDRLTTILKDKRLPFKAVINSNSSSLPDYIGPEEDDYKELKAYVSQDDNNFVPPTKGLAFVMPSTRVISFHVGPVEKKKKRDYVFSSSDDSDY